MVSCGGNTGRYDVRDGEWWGDTSRYDVRELIRRQLKSCVCALYPIVCVCVL